MKKKTESAPVYKRSKVIGRVAREYVQINVPDAQIEATVEALCHALTSDYYARYLMTETNQNFD